MKKLIFLSLVLSTSVTIAQRDSPDTYSTENGDLSIQPILHGTFVLTWNGFTIYNDPYGGAAAFKGMENPDLVLITDIHGDHYNQQTLDELDLSKASVIAPAAVAEQISGDFQIIVMKNHEINSWNGITIKALPMYNLPVEADTRHPKGRGNGYILTLGDKNIYISGDTEDIPEMRSLSGIDIAFVCMNQPYTMSVEQAASAVLEFKPKVVYPFHYRGQGGFSDVNLFKQIVEKDNPTISVVLKNWYPSY